MPLEIDIHQDDGIYTMVVTGDFDLRSAPAFRTQLMAAISEESAVTLDLSGVAYMDSSGVAVLISARKESNRTSTPFSVQDPSIAVRRVLRALSLEPLFGIS